ncbi:hypothetical protein MTR_1g102920 [Medicago truncatula]|uniref:Uncharacterized protein n=1 Tax=Medicago truncatula TaxID=3880 RepID=A0A072W0I1_MEDTR|nr:hypothetical protein MTR_1g102920 [Medicago truncatula]
MHISFIKIIEEQNTKKHEEKPVSGGHAATRKKLQTEAISRILTILTVFSKNRSLPAPSLSFRSLPPPQFLPPSLLKLQL